MLITSSCTSKVDGELLELQWKHPGSRQVRTPKAEEQTQGRFIGCSCRSYHVAKETQILMPDKVTVANSCDAAACRFRLEKVYPEPVCDQWVNNQVMYTCVAI